MSEPYEPDDQSIGVTARPLYIKDEVQCIVTMHEWDDFLLNNKDKFDGYVVECDFDEFSQGTSRSWILYVCGHPRFQEVEGMMDWEGMLECADWPADSEIRFCNEGYCMLIPVKKIFVGDVQLNVFVIHLNDRRRRKRKANRRSGTPVFAY